MGNVLENVFVVSLTQVTQKRKISFQKRENISDVFDRLYANMKLFYD